jgi:GNAT superfamily N-acetyltransferase
MDIRPIQPHEVPDAKGVIRAVWREHFYSDPNPLVRTYLDRDDAFPDLDDFSNSYAGPRGTFLVLVEGKNVVGTGGIRPVNASTAELTHLFLLPDYRGIGVGRKIAEELLIFARGAGYKRVRLGSNKRLLASHALYRKLGFRDIPAYEPGGELHAYYMELPL